MTTRAKTKEKEKRSNIVRAKRSSAKEGSQKSSRSDRKRGRSGHGPREHPLLELQQSHGNQAVQRVVENRTQSSMKTLPGVESRINSLEGNGRPLSEATRTLFESGFGADFSNVRIHTSTAAHEASEALSARAFTTGRDVFFRRGEYSPTTKTGQELLAHELTHVVQQNGKEISGKLTVSQPGDTSEREADKIASAIMHRIQRIQLHNASHHEVEKFSLVAKEQIELSRQVVEEELEQEQAPNNRQEDRALIESEEQKENTEADISAGESPVRRGERESAGSSGGMSGGPGNPGVEPVNEVPVEVEDKEAAIADAQSETEAANAAQKVGIGPDGNRDGKAIPVETEKAMGRFEIEQYQRQNAEVINRWPDVRDRIDLWYSNLYVAMRAPPDMIETSYDQGYNPQVYFNHEYSWDTHTGPSGHYRINGVVHDNWDTEDEWTNLRPIPTTSLSWPAPDVYGAQRNNVEATFITRPDFHWDERIARAGSFIGTYASSLVGEPTERITSWEFNPNDATYIGQGVGSGETSGGRPINVTVSQAVNRQTSSTATGTFGNTTSFSSETSAGISGTVQEKDKWELGAELSGKWTEGEERSASRSLSKSVSLMTQNSTSVSTSYEVTQDIPSAIMLVPVEKHITNNFSIRDSDGSGLIPDQETRDRRIRRISEIAVPGGWTAVYGYDEQYASALQTHYNEVRALRQECVGLRGGRLEAKKAEIRQKIVDFRAQNWPSEARARVDAQRKLATLTASPDPDRRVNNPFVSPDNVKAWQDAVNGFWSFANSPTE